MISSRTDHAERVETILVNRVLCVIVIASLLHRLIFDGNCEMKNMIIIRQSILLYSSRHGQEIYQQITFHC